jgi:hypothetical protein
MLDKRYGYAMIELDRGSFRRFPCPLRKQPFVIAIVLVRIVQGLPARMKDRTHIRSESQECGGQSQ